MNEIVVKVLDFTEYPDVRYIEQDVNSGEQFYNQIIRPNFENALIENKILIVDLDNTAGYASSFLDEAFGNLVYDFDYKKILTHLKIISKQEPDWIDIIFNKIIPTWKKKFDKKLPRKEV